MSKLYIEIIDPENPLLTKKDSFDKYRLCIDLAFQYLEPDINKILGLIKDINGCEDGESRRIFIEKAKMLWHSFPKDKKDYMKNWFAPSEFREEWPQFLENLDNLIQKNVEYDLALDSADSFIKCNFKGQEKKIPMGVKKKK